MLETILGSGFLGVLVLYLHRSTSKQITGLRKENADQGTELRGAIADQGKVTADQGTELRRAIADQGTQLRGEIAGCESRLGERISDLSAAVTALTTITLDLSRSVGRLEGAHDTTRRAEAA